MRPQQCTCSRGTFYICTACLSAGRAAWRLCESRGAPQAVPRARPGTPLAGRECGSGVPDAVESFSVRFTYTLQRCIFVVLSYWIKLSLSSAPRIITCRSLAHLRRRSRPVLSRASYALPVPLGLAPWHAACAVADAPRFDLRFDPSPHPRPDRKRNRTPRGPRTDAGALHSPHDMWGSWPAPPKSD